MTCVYDDYVFHYVVEAGICYLCKSSGFFFVFALFLEHIKSYCYCILLLGLEKACRTRKANTGSHLLS